MMIYQGKGERIHPCALAPGHVYKAQPLYFAVHTRLGLLHRTGHHSRDDQKCHERAEHWTRVPPHLLVC